MSADAIIFPIRENFIEAVEEAMKLKPPNGHIYTDGNRVAWLPRAVIGWEPINFSNIREAI